jgi:isochorismate pyruvate lyase
MNIINCKNIDEIRFHIDRLDHEIVKLIAERSQYVKQAAKFKKDDADVKAPKRVEEVIEKVKNISKNYELNTRIIEDIYRIMINDFINFEMKEYKDLK